MRWAVVAVVCIVLLSGCGSILDGGGPSSPTPETPGEGTETPTETESPVGDISSSAPDRPLDAAEAGLPVRPRGRPVDHLELFVRSMEAYDQDVRSVRVADDGSVLRYRFRRGEDAGEELEDVAVTFAVLVGEYDWDVDRLAGTIEGADGGPIATFEIDADVAEDAYHGEVTQQEYFEHVQESIELLETDEGTATPTPGAAPGPGAGSTPDDTATPTPDETPESGTGPTETPTETATPSTPEPTATRTPTATASPTRTTTATPSPTTTATATRTTTATATRTTTPTPTGGTDQGTATPTSTATADGNGSTATPTTNGTESTSARQGSIRAAVGTLLLLVPLGALPYARRLFGRGED